MRLQARHYRTGQAVTVSIQNGLIEAVELSAPASPEADFSAGWIAPGLFDLQINGALGRAFSSSDLSIDDIRVVVECCHSHGITGLCPTLITAAQETLLHGFSVLRKACDEEASLARALPCFHLEGPYISPQDGPRGAHPLEHVRPPDLEEFARLQDAAGGRIRLVTLAPEQPGAIAFIEKVTTQGVIVAIGHTAATGPQIRDAIRAGARLSTHLGNGSHAMLPRHENYLWEQLAADELLASFIPDGHHLPVALMRCLIRTKTCSRLIVTCDASSLAGLPPGRQGMWGQELEVLPTGKVIVPGTPFLAGSAVFTDACIRKLLELQECSLAQSLDMAGAQPRHLLGQPAIELQPGYPADVVLFDYGPDGPFTVRLTLVAGRPHRPGTMSSRPGFER